MSWIIGLANSGRQLGKIGNAVHRSVQRGEQAEAVGAQRGVFGVARQPPRPARRAARGDEPRRRSVQASDLSLQAR